MSRMDPAAVTARYGLTPAQYPDFAALRGDPSDNLPNLPGVGEKTAACVLMFDMGLPAFPVDTHVSRVCRRVGFVPEKASPDDICVVLEREVPPSRYLGGHVNIIEHGRAVCAARKPLCGACPLTALCNEGRGRIAEAMAAEMHKGRQRQGRVRRGEVEDGAGKS